MASKETIDKCRELCKTYGVKYRFPKTRDGKARSFENRIVVGTEHRNNLFVSVVFHEIQHCLNYRNGKYMTYHQPGKTEKEMRRWMLPAEIYTDVMGKKLAAKHGFYKYITTYRNDEASRKFVNGFIERSFG